MIDLHDWSRPLQALIPDDLSADEVELSGEQLSEPPLALACADLVIERRVHDYSALRVDELHWSGSKAAYEGLALLILGSLLHPRPDQRWRRGERVLHLTSPVTEVKAVVIQPVHMTEETLTLRVERVRYGYEPVKRHPWLVDAPAPYTLPWMKLSNARDCVGTEADRAARDHVYGFGTMHGTARFANLLLNLSRSANDQREVALEVEGGFRGVAPLSGEARLWLPGGDFWTSPTPG
jgi:hypothetical protein